MRVFVTGASGFIGRAVVEELLGAQHEVLGLARSDEAAAALRAAGIDVHRGSLDDPASLAEGARACDGVIHLAYKHDFTDMAAAARDDRAAVRAMGEALRATDKPLSIASGTLALAVGFSPPLGRTGTEEDVPNLPGPRIDTETDLIELAHTGVRTSSVRLAPTVHGEGDHGFVPRLISIAREGGVSAYVGDGANRWPAVHRRDAARLFRLALESAPAGTRLHAVGDEGVAFRDIAASIGRHLDVPVRSLPAAAADAHFGFLGRLVALDNPTSSALTQRRLGWTPTHASLLADLDEGHYFSVN
jgi:nucleoside-diphosphate-sugar epimerase